MPELPEVEIVTRRLDRALAGALVESAAAPGVNVLRTVEPALESIAGRRITAVRRRGKLPIVELGEVALLIHLMSAGSLTVGDRPASPRDRGARLLVRLAGGRELRLRERGTRQRAWIKLLPTAALDSDEALASLGPEALPTPDAASFATLVDQPRHLHPLLRDQRTIAGIGRAWVDDILWEAELSPFRQGSDLTPEEAERLRSAVRSVLEGAIASYEEAIGDELPARMPKALRVHGRHGQACPRCGRTLEAVHFKERSTTYCPACQTAGRVLRDRRLSRLLR